MDMLGALKTASPPGILVFPAARYRTFDVAAGLEL